MSTRSSIGIQHPNGNISMIYCHNNGYPAGNGKLLYDHYQNTAKILRLIRLGSISSLDTSPNKPPAGHKFGAPVAGYVVAYHRDRGDVYDKPHNTAILKNHNLNYYNRSVRNTFSDCEWHYLYVVAAKAWMIRTRGSVLTKLTPEIIANDSL